MIAHDQVWGGDDWLTIAFVPPLLCVLSLAVITAVERSRDSVVFAARFFGIVCGGAWLVMWALAGAFWLAGWL